MLLRRLLEHILSGRDGEEEKIERERKSELDSHHFVMAFPSFHDTREMADFVRESFPASSSSGRLLGFMPAFYVI